MNAAKWPLRLLLAAAALATVALGAFAYGYVVRGEDKSAANRAVQRVLRKIDKIRGLPSAAEIALRTVESTFIRFRGTLHPLPGSDYLNGGALTVWGDDLLVMPRSGRVHVLEEGEGLAATSIRPPDNGADNYAEFAETPDYAGYVHKPRTVRFNDILYVDRPEFRGLIVSYTFFDRARICYGTRLARAALDPSVASAREAEVAPDDWTVFFETTPCLELNPDWTALDGIMAGGRIALAEDGRIILGSGEYHLDGIHTRDVGIMDPGTSYGKILAIDPETGEAEILAMGHRNVQGVTIDAAGQLWTIEHGVRGGDELNHIRPGENHGWPEESYGTLYSGQPLPLDGIEGRHEVYDKPAFAWLPSAGTSALAAIDGFHPAWDGGLVAGALSNEDFGQSLYFIRTEGARVVFVERIRLRRRVRYVQQFGDRLAVWLDQTDLLLLEQAARRDPLGDVLSELRESHPPDVADRTERVLRACNQCHSFEQFEHAAAPSLNGVVGRRIASTDFRGHSETLAGVPGAWTEEALARYLVDPNAFAPGTSMPAAELTEGPVLDALIWALKNIDTTKAIHLKYN